MARSKPLIAWRHHIRTHSFTVAILLSSTPLLSGCEELLAPGPATSLIVEGRVMSTAGPPVAGVEVSLTMPLAVEGMRLVVATDRTDTGGAFRLEADVECSEPEVRFEGNDYGAPLRWSDVWVDGEVACTNVLQRVTIWVSPA